MWFVDVRLLVMDAELDAKPGHVRIQACPTHRAGAHRIRAPRRRRAHRDRRHLPHALHARPAHERRHDYRRAQWLRRADGAGAAGKAGGSAQRGILEFLASPQPEPDIRRAATEPASAAGGQEAGTQEAQGRRDPSEACDGAG